MSRPLPRPSVAAAALALSIDRQRAGSIAVQLGQQLREMILSGRMRRLARLPSSRALAIDLGISRATVVHAYEQLASEGYVEGRHRRDVRFGGTAGADAPERRLADQATRTLVANLSRTISDRARPPVPA